MTPVSIKIALAAAEEAIHIADIANMADGIAGIR